MKLYDCVCQASLEDFRSGGESYPYAYVSNLNPFQLVSEKGDMLWNFYSPSDVSVIKTNITELPIGAHNRVCPDKKKKAIINIYRINTSKRTLSTLSNEVFTNIKDFFKDKLPTKGSVFTGYLYDFDFTINNVCMIGTDLLDDPTVFQHIVDDKIILAASLSYEYVLSI